MVRTIIDTAQEVNASADKIWRVWADVDRWHEWDPHEERAHLLTGFVTGGRAYSKPVGAPGGEFELIEVVPRQLWVSSSRLPLGTLRSEHTIEAVGPDRSRVRIRATATGLGAWIVDLGWGRRMRADSRRTIAALEHRALALP